MFDRVIFLSEGYVIYNGAPESCANYMMQFGLPKLIHTNAADKMSVIAAQPRTILNPNATIKMLADECKKQQDYNMHLSERERQDMSGILSRRFTDRDTERRVSFCRQYILIFNRNMTTALRNPLQILAVVILGLF